MASIVGGIASREQIPTPMQQDDEPIALTVPDECAGLRLDAALAKLLPVYSRSLLRTWIDGARVTVNGATLKPKHALLGGEHIRIRPELRQRIEATPQAIALDIVYEDSELIVVNKPAGLVVHPGAGNTEGTLLNALIHHDPSCTELPRAGIVHRLDKDTTGLLVISRTLRAHTSLVRQLQDRHISREYQAVVRGLPVAGGTLNAAIGRHPTVRTRMAVVRDGRPAVTHFRVASRFNRHALLHVRLETGRTHQIRVHLADAGYPIVGDPVYGGRAILPPGTDAELAKRLQSFGRQALHAWRLKLEHPATGEACAWEAPLPADMQALLIALKLHAESTGAGHS